MLQNPMFRFLKLSCLGALALPMGALASSCSNMSDKCENTNTCAGLDADAGDAGKCDDPSTQPCAIRNARGVFVSAATGSDTDGAADGTREKPFRSVGKALATAGVQKKNVYVCAGSGDYTETQTLTLDVALSGVSLFGGFNCADWTYSTTLKSKIVSSSPNAIIIDGVTSGMRLADFEVQAADATQLGTSSLAVQVRSSQSVTLRRVKVTAGRGAAGAPGANGEQGADGAEPGEAQKGKGARCTASKADQPGGVLLTPTCGSSGGRGGAASVSTEQSGGDGESGTPATNLRDPDIDNHGAGATAAGPEHVGGDGTRGVPGNPGPDALPPAEVGTWTAGGYAPASGRAGTNGSPGQGGGGGGASKSNASCVGASGGAGGMGGCGGGAGQGGGGGGASVALFVWQSGVTIEACELIARDGGVGAQGGAGGQGGSGKRGGDGGGASGTAAAGGQGGPGGTGGGGGSGSGGTGGASYALVSHGNEVKQVGSNSLTAGSGGAAGAGGSLIGLGVDPAPSGSVGASDKRLVCLASAPCVSRP